MSLGAEQIEAYLDYIEVPEHTRLLLREGPGGKHALEAVTKLQQRQLAKVPLENLDLVYSSHHSLPPELDTVYDNIVRRRRGGVCDQVHVLFAELLKSFGFVVYLTGGRINTAAGLRASPHMDKTKPSFGPWVHLNTIVTIGDQDYLVDTSHGPSGSPSPVPLVHDQPMVDIWPRQRRLIYDSLPGCSHQKQKWWRLQIKSNTNEPWLDVWAFTETEWQVWDFKMLRIAYGTLGTIWAAPQPASFLTLFEDETPVGYLLLVDNEVRKNYKGETKVIRKLYSESDRVASLEEDFGIVLTEDEQSEISGMAAELLDEEFDYYG